MMRTRLKTVALSALFVVAGFASAMAAQVSSQAPVPVNAVGNSELLIQSQAVTGGTIYTSVVKQAGNPGAIVGVSQSFVPTAAGGILRYLPLTGGKSDPGVSLTATPGTPTGAVGVTRTAGTSLVLTGEATSSSAKTNKVIWEINLPDSYVAGANVPVIVNCLASGGTITGSSTTMTVAAYTETAGVEAALTVSAAQQIPAVATPLTFTITGTALTPGQHIVLELVMLVTTSAGAGTGVINSVAIQG